MANNDKIGIVTVLYNSEKVLNDFFSSLNNQKYQNIELYVINNKSPDNSLNKAKEFSKDCFFKTFFIDNDDNYGVAKGNNQGIKMAVENGCDYVLLSNNDIILNPDTISSLYNRTIELKADMSVPKIFLYESGNLWCAGGEFNKLKAQTIHYGYNQKDCEQYNVEKQVSYSPTCFMLINKDVFNDVGFMDENYFVYYDDTDFVYRTQMKNKKLYYIPNSSLIHKESVCTGKRSDFFFKYMFRNRIYFYSKYSKFWKLFYCFDIIYQNTIRKYKMGFTKQQCKLVKDSLKEGYKLAIKK